MAPHYSPHQITILNHPFVPGFTMIREETCFTMRQVGGIKFDLLDVEAVPRLMNQWRRSGRQCYVSLVNPHSVMMCKRDQRLNAAIGEAALVLPDGIGIVLACHILGYGRQHRVSGPNLMLHVCDAGRMLGFRHYFYGGARGVADRLAERLAARYPGLEVAGTHMPPFHELSAEEDEAEVSRINAARPDIVWVGMGAPKQEKWMAAHAGRIHATAMLGVGAAFDFHSGNVPWAPRWVRRIGCEWAYRLMLEPRRMWRRNLDSPLFLATVLKEAMTRSLRGLSARADEAIHSLAELVEGDQPQGGAGASAKTPPLGLSSFR